MDFQRSFTFGLLNGGVGLVALGADPWATATAFICNRHMCIPQSWAPSSFIGVNEADSAKVSN
jgi:hypothetical protein